MDKVACVLSQTPYHPDESVQPELTSVMIGYGESVKFVCLYLHIVLSTAHLSWALTFQNFWQLWV